MAARLPFVFNWCHTHMASITGHLPKQATVAEPDLLNWPAIAWFTALLIVVYFPILEHLVMQWSTDEDVGHGFFVIPVAAYIAWQRRDELLAIERKPAWWGLGHHAVGGSAELPGYARCGVVSTAIGDSHHTGGLVTGARRNQAGQGTGVSVAAFAVYDPDSNW